MTSESTSSLIQVKADPQTGKVKVTIPGFTYGDANRFGYVTMDKVALMAGKVCFIVYLPHALEIEYEYDQHFTLLNHYSEFRQYFKSSVIEIHPGFYDNFHFYNAIHGTTQIVNIGKTSYHHLTRAVSESTGEILFQNTVCVVNVDKEKFRPVELPETFKQQFKNNDSNISLDQVQVQIKPPVTYNTEYIVRWSDIDGYGHTNQSAYFRIATNSIVEASLQGQFTDIAGDIERLRIKTMKCIFHSETLPGERLTIHVWEDDRNSNVIHSIVESAGKPAFQGSIEYAENGYNSARL